MFVEFAWFQASEERKKYCSRVVLFPFLLTNQSERSVCRFKKPFSCSPPCCLIHSNLQVKASAPFLVLTNSFAALSRFIYINLLDFFPFSTRFCGLLICSIGPKAYKSTRIFFSPFQETLSLPVLVLFILVCFILRINANLRASSGRLFHTDTQRKKYL